MADQKAIYIGVVGDAAYCDYNASVSVTSMLDDVFRKYPNAVLVSGSLPGPECIASEYAHNTGNDIVICGTGWTKYGHSAMHHRNSRIGTYSQVLIAWCNGHDSNTLQIIMFARAAGNIVHVINY